MLSVRKSSTNAHRQGQEITWPAFSWLLWIESIGKKNLLLNSIFNINNSNYVIDWRKNWTRTQLRWYLHERYSSFGFKMSRCTIFFNYLTHSDRNERKIPSIYKSSDYYQLISDVTDRTLYCTAWTCEDSLLLMMIFTKYDPIMIDWSYYQKVGYFYSCLLTPSMKLR